LVAYSLWCLFCARIRAGHRSGETADPVVLDFPMISRWPAAALGQLGLNKRRAPQFAALSDTQTYGNTDAAKVTWIAIIAPNITMIVLDKRLMMRGSKDVVSVKFDVSVISRTSFLILNSDVKSRGEAHWVCSRCNYPQPSEVRAGLALVERAGQRDSAGELLTIRIGIATGLVIVGDLAGVAARWSTAPSARRSPALAACRRSPNRARYCSTSKPDGLSAAYSNIPSSAFGKRDGSASRCRRGRYCGRARRRAGSRHCADLH
jgi:hypothetical protein